MDIDIREINSIILRMSEKIKYVPQDNAPTTENELFNCGELKIWTGESDTTIYQDKLVNWAFRSIHDTLHISSRLDFSVPQEIEMGRLQASKIDSDFLSDLFYIEIAGQAEYYLKTGNFIQNQIDFTLNQLKGVKCEKYN